MPCCLACVCPSAWVPSPTTLLCSLVYCPYACANGAWSDASWRSHLPNNLAIAFHPSFCLIFGSNSTSGTAYIKLTIAVFSLHFAFCHQLTVGGHAWHLGDTLVLRVASRLTHCDAALLRSHFMQCCAAHDSSAVMLRHT